MAFNIGTGLAFVCPVTNQLKGSGFEVPLPGGLRVTGGVLCDHLRSVDWLARGAQFQGKAPAITINEVLARIYAIMPLAPPSVGGASQ